MKKINQIFAILILTLYTSCAQEKSDFNKIRIDSEKCKEWNLPQVNFTSEIPKEYVMNFNESGGFYFQAKKYGEKNKLLAEISISGVDGDLRLNQDNIIEVLKQAEGDLKKVNAVEGINYETSFIGESEINNEKLKHLRGFIEFNNYDKSIDGKYYNFVAPIVKDDKNQILISSMFIETEEFNKEKISLELLKVLSSIKFIE